MKKMIYILLFITLTCSFCETFQVRCAQSPHLVLKDNNVTLEWTFTRRSLNSLHFYCFVSTYQKNITFLEYENGVEIPQSGLFKGRVQLDTNVLKKGRIRLDVSSLRTEDSGLYSCEVNTNEGSDKDVCKVNVTETFKVEFTETYKEVFEIGNATLEWIFTNSSLDTAVIYCFVITNHNVSVLLEYVKGDVIPRPGLFEGRVEWEKDVLGEGKIRLQMSSLRTKDSGNYTCDVDTREGRGEATCHMNVTANPHATTDTKTETGPAPENRNIYFVIFIVLIVPALGISYYYWHKKKTGGGSYI